MISRDQERIRSYHDWLPELFFDSSVRKVHARTQVQLLQTVFSKILVSQVDNCFAFVCVPGRVGMYLRVCGKL